MNTMTTARNLWHNPQSAYSPREFTYQSGPLFTYRGVEVFRNPAGSWDYVIDGTAITQRAGFHKDNARLVIDGILDGKDTGHFHWVCDAVANHLRFLGFTPLGYSDKEPATA